MFATHLESLQSTTGGQQESWPLSVSGGDQGTNISVHPSLTSTDTNINRQRVHGKRAAGWLCFLIMG